MNQSIRFADAVGAAAPVLSFAPVVLRAPGRPVDLQLRVSAPATGRDLPIILLSHGHGPSNFLSSLYGYSPLADFYAAHGFVVIQPTHLDSAMLGLRSSGDPEAPLFWRARAQDMTRILDRLDEIEDAVPTLPGRLDRDRVAAVGHTVGLLLGARLTDPRDGTKVDLAEPRIAAGVLLAAPGRGGDALSGFAAENYPFLSSTDFSRMTAPALVVRGGQDRSAHLTVAGPDWYADPYELAPAPKTLLTLSGAEHGLGGVSGYDVAETTDENPGRVAALQELTRAYLRAALYGEEHMWQTARDALTAGDDPVGQVASK